MSFCAKSSRFWATRFFRVRIETMRKIRRIGLPIDAVGGYGRGVIGGIVAYSRTNPRWTIAVEPFWSFASAPDLNQCDVDGLIVQTFSEAFEEKVIARGVPAVNISTILDRKPRLPTVSMDHAAVARMAADYLLSLGLREIGYCWPGSLGFGRLRLEAFRARITSKGVNFHECNTSSQDLKTWLTKLPKPVGILGCNDDNAHRVLNAAYGARLKVPDEVAVLGVDDDAFFNTMFTPSLSSIALPAEQIGHRAAMLLDRLLDGKPAPARPIQLRPVRVVARASTDIVWVGDDDVAAALRYIRDNTSQPLQIDDVLDHVPLSRRSLTRRFRQVVGRSVSDEIRRAHIERAKQLLITTDMEMKQVAAASGLIHATRLGILFRRAVGQTPTEFRKRFRYVGAR
jgi:LacI family transcriptional regulator